MSQFFRELAAGKPFSRPYSMNLAGIVHAACHKLLFLRGWARNIGFCPSSLKGILVVDKSQIFEKHVWPFEAMRDNPADNDSKSFRINAIKKGDEWGVDPSRFSKWDKTKLKNKLKNGSSLMWVWGWVYRVIDNYRRLLQQQTTGERIREELKRTE